MSYTFLAFSTAIFSLLLDYILKTNLLKRKLFWLTHAFVALMNMAVNGYLTSRPIVLYADEFFMGFRLGSIPIEDFFYGFGLITLNIVLFEFFLRKRDQE
jgi:lycopene cyclase domain-containing protein